INLNKNYNLEISMYLSREKEINDKLSINVGVRSSWFADLGPHYQYKIKTPSGIVDTLIYTDYGKIRNSFISFEPRITARYLINENSSLKGSISFVQQNLHLISNSTAGLPYDYWITASKEIKPQTSTQYLIGYFTNLFSKKISLSIEAYYKTLNNILDFKDNSNLLTEKSIEINTLQGIGRSYGVELFVEKNVGKHVGWISYTLARTQYKIENVNNDQWYSPRYDIRHNLSIVWIKKISDRKELSMTFKYTSGGFISLPTAIGNFDGALFSIYNFKNNYELPSYNRADLSYKLKTKRYFKSKLKKEWVFTLYNVYAKENIFSLVYRPVVNKPSDTDGIRNNPEFKIYNYNELYKFYLFSIIPTITFNVKF
ncbi:MAG: TonB-dependent receptor, partial [Sediminibacterium sp.]|nr:TonB-dependent receptor [Sediminibacterium sp.]